MWALLIIAGTCWTPFDAGMSVMPDGLTPAGEVVELLTPAPQPTDASGPLFCENPLDPRCALSQGVPPPAHYSGKHAPDIWTRACTFVLPSVYTQHVFGYDVHALSGFPSRLERPPLFS
jgi:hypothetical protein